MTSSFSTTTGQEADPYALHSERHPGRSYWATLRAVSSPLSPQRLCTELQAETALWMTLITDADPTQVLETFVGIRYALSALKHESKALSHVEQAIGAQQACDWTEAATFYSHAITDLDCALSDWLLALSDLAEDTPFDPSTPTTETRALYRVKDLPQPSYEDLCQISPHVFRLYWSVDRALCLLQELVQRQNTCLITLRQEAEARQR